MPPSPGFSPRSAQSRAAHLLTARRLWGVATLSVATAVGVVLAGVLRGKSWEAMVSVHVAWVWVGAAVGLAVLRDVGYMVRLWVLARGELTPKRTASSILLWELASALTPSVVGGSAVATFLLHRNGLNWGRSLATVMSTALLDELFFVVAIPAVAVVAGFHAFLPSAAPWVAGSLGAVFAGGVAFMAGLAAFLATALFAAPGWIYRRLHRLFQRPLLRRVATPGQTLAADLLQASRDLRSMSWRGWAVASLATAVSWCARFLTLNALLLAVLAPTLDDGSGMDHLAVAARQLAMWTVMLLSPTPGATGLAELALPTFMEGVLPLTLGAGTWAAAVLLWRGLTCHIYLLVGGALMPVWVAQTSSHNRADSRTFEAHE